MFLQRIKSIKPVGILWYSLCITGTDPLIDEQSLLLQQCSGEAFFVAHKTTDAYGLREKRLRIEPRKYCLTFGAQFVMRHVLECVMVYLRCKPQSLFGMASLAAIAWRAAAGHRTPACTMSIVITFITRTAFLCRTTPIFTIGAMVGIVFLTGHECCSHTQQDKTTDNGQ